MWSSVPFRSCWPPLPCYCSSVPEHLFIMLRSVNDIANFTSFSDAQKFSLPGVTEDKFGNKSGSVDFEWTYTTPDLSKTNIYCGLSRSVVVQKKPGGVASIQPAFAGRADPIDVTTVSPNRIGYKLRNLDFSDANSYFCTMVYDSGSPEYSKNYNFKIYGKYYFLATD